MCYVIYELTVFDDFSWCTKIKFNKNLFLFIFYTNKYKIKFYTYKNKIKL